MGLVGGLLVAHSRPEESSIHYNILGAMLGERLHEMVVERLGSPSSPYSSKEVPWILRLPQALVLGSVVVWVLAGVMAALVDWKIVRIV